MKAIVLALLTAATVGGSAMALSNGTSDMNTASTSAMNAGGECVCVPCPSPCPPECQVVCCE